MTVRCRTCGRQFPRDPAKEVPCPQCGADVGSPCRRPSEHRCSIHYSRDRLALAVTDYGPCPEGGGETPHEAARKLLDDDQSLTSALEKMDLSREDLRRIALGEESDSVDSADDSATVDAITSEQSALNRFQ